MLEGGNGGVVFRFSASTPESDSESDSDSEFPTPRILSSKPAFLGNFRTSRPLILTRGAGEIGGSGKAHSQRYVEIRTRGNGS